MSEVITQLPIEVLRAEQRLRAYVRETPLIESMALGAQGQCRVFLKLENLQLTGSFKVRGALNMVLSLPIAQRRYGVVTASSGNHAAGVAYALRLLGVPGVIFVSETAAPAKLALLQRLGATIRCHGRDPLEAEFAAQHFAVQQGMTYVSPYNDVRVIAGQGSVGVEVARQLPSIDRVYVAVGGGGLIAGVAGYLKALNPALTVVGCQPAAAPVMCESIRAGQVVEWPLHATLSDATAGGIEPGAITFDVCRALVDSFVVVGEEEIAAAMRWCIVHEQLLIEGAAGVAVAGYLQDVAHVRGRNVVIVICGANVGVEVLRQIL